jgi:hypothetical protein
MICEATPRTENYAMGIAPDDTDETLPSPMFIFFDAAGEILGNGNNAEQPLGTNVDRAALGRLLQQLEGIPEPRAEWIPGAIALVCALLRRYPRG